MSPVKKPIGNGIGNAVNLAVSGLILRELRQINEGITLVTDATSRIEAAISGIQGDITGLKESAQNLQTALDEALAQQPQDVQDQINAAVSQAQEAFDAQLDQVASKLEDLDAQTAAGGGSGDTTPPEGSGGEPPRVDNTLPNEIPVEGEPPVVDPRSGRQQNRR